MDYLVLVIQAIICVTSFMMADYMVTHRTGLANEMIIGKDPDEVVAEMLKLAVATFNSKKEEITKLKDYTVCTNVQNGKIVKAIVETEKTILTYNPNEGEIITNKGFTERGAKILNTIFMLALLTLIHVILYVLCM